jgi:hypothetical protein
MRAAPGVVLIGLLACTASPPTPPPAPTTEAVLEPFGARGALDGIAVPGDGERRLCDAACVDAHRQACTPGRAWRLRMTNPGMSHDVIVTATGLVRHTLGERALFSIDGEQALLCLPGCGRPPGTCLPFPFRFRANTIKGDGVKTMSAAQLRERCPRTDRDGPRWRGHASRRVTLACPDYQLGFVVIPALVPVRDALIRARVTRPDDLAVWLGGLLVAISIDGDELEQFTVLEEAPCAELALPPGYAIDDEASHVTRMRAAAAAAPDSLQLPADDAAPRTMTDMMALLAGPLCRAYLAN